MLLKSKKVIILLLIIATAIMMVFYFLQKTPSADLPVAKNGFIDLSDWNFDKDGNIKLDGEWEFYWGSLLTPDDFATAKPNSSIYPDGYIKVPSPWKGKIGNAQLSDNGVATYRLKVRLGSVNTMYGIKTTSIRMSNIIFVDGLEVGKRGNPAMSYKDGYIMANTPYVTFFHPKSNELEVIVQVADFDYRAGGIVQSIYLGKRTDIFVMAGRFNFFNGFVAACLLITGIYYLFVYLGRRKDLSLMYYSAYAITFSFFELAYGEKILNQMFPDIPEVIITKVLNILLYASIIFICLFIKSITGKLLPDWFTRTVVIVMGGYIVLLSVLPIKMSLSVQDIFLLFGMTVYVFILAFLVFAVVQEQYGNLGRNGFIQLIIALTCVLIYFADGVIYINNMKNDNYIGYAALLLFIAMISSMLSQQYNNAYNTIERMSVKLLESDRLKDEFLVNTSHELKTPLHGIINITRSVLESASGTIAEKQKESLNFVVTIAKRLSSLINDIIDFQNLKNHTLHMDIRVFDLHAPVQVVLEVLKYMRAEKELSLVNRIPPGTFFVRADENRLRQIIYNLVGNALKYTERGKVEIMAWADENRIVVSVEDTGMGIPEASQESIFLPFDHTGNTGASEYRSSGLGLPISRRLAEHMGGKLLLDWSVPGKGSRFIFTLPSDSGKEAADKSAAAAAYLQYGADTEEAAQKSAHSRFYTILLVDDEVSNIRVLTDMFREEDYETVVAYNGGQALEMIRQNRNISLVLLDVMMPGMSGFEVCRKIREEYSLSDLPVLLLTVRNTPQDIETGFKAGANDFVAKPFNARELRARVSTLIMLRRSVGEAVANEMAFLQSQIKPHFLYNALSTIMNLCYTDGEKAGNLLASLSEYLKKSFDIDSTACSSSLESELELTKAYTDIEQARFRERLKMVYRIDSSLPELRILPLTIQPLVENAVRHGIMPRESGGTVTLSVQKAGEFVEVCVEDDGVGFTDAEAVLKKEAGNKKQRNGVGLSNIQRRLVNSYGSGLWVNSSEETGTRVTFHIPLDMKDRNHEHENNGE